jgi:hypothetical protein
MSRKILIVEDFCDLLGMVLAASGWNPILASLTNLVSGERPKAIAATGE